MKKYSQIKHTQPKLPEIVVEACLINFTVVIRKQRLWQLAKQVATVLQPKPPALGVLQLIPTTSGHQLLTLAGAS
jgi:hypothetical protein